MKALISMFISAIVLAFGAEAQEAPVPKIPGLTDELKDDPGKKELVECAMAVMDCWADAFWDSHDYDCYAWLGLCSLLIEGKVREGSLIEQEGCPGVAATYPSGQVEEFGNERVVINELDPNRIVTINSSNFKKLPAPDLRTTFNIGRGSEADGANGYAALTSCATLAVVLMDECSHILGDEGADVDPTSAAGKQKNKDALNHEATVLDQALLGLLNKVSNNAKAWECVFTQPPSWPGAAPVPDKGKFDYWNEFMQKGIEANQAAASRGGR